MASDDEDVGERVSGGDDVALPKATVNKFANELASSLGVRLALESRELLVQVCTEFVQLLSSEANDVCEKDSKKTITAEHVLRALQTLGLDKYYQEVADEYARLKSGDKGKNRGGWQRLQESGMSQEALLKQQQALFNLARADPVAAASVPHASIGEDDEEEF
mmetsp:Transcript_10051/g.26855  ORF Transcript_10051/g.26855 Transcript_10051/m.26855 type:complete len:163 (-) Transcript_10051:2171-2659(-)